MDAFTIAEELIPGIELTADQLAQLRAIDNRYYSRLFALRQGPAAATAPDDPAPRGRELTAEETSQLRAMLIQGVLELLTPEQRLSLEGGGGLP
jgi:hypothetical protein